MKLDIERVSEYGSFSIEPTEGRKILAVFLDFETKLLIVEELAARTGDSQLVYVTTIDARAARIIPPGERKNRIDYSEQSETDEEAGLKRVFRREIDTETGNESFSEQLYKSNVQIGRSTRIAFRKSKPETILDSYRRRLEEQEHQELFWKTEYAAKTFEDRAAYWAASIHRHMRWQSESGLDEYAGFTPEWYELAKRREPEFDKILSFMFERYKHEFAYQDCSTDEILRRIGKS
jgi:hypothetical protein